MSRPRLALTSVLAGITALAIIACSGGAASPSTIPSVAIPAVSIPAISIPPIPTVSIPPIPSFSIPPLPSGVGTPSFAIPTFHQAPELENALPNQIRGVTLEKASYTGELFLGGSNDQTFQKVMQQFNKQPSDLTIAGAHDTTGALSFQLLAFRLAGVDASQFVAAVIAAGQASGSTQPTITTATVGGKQVTMFTDVAGTKSYFYPKGEVAYFVESDADDADALVGDIFAAIP